MSEPDLTPTQTEAVRALLAGARHVDTVPADVAARLDATLAELRAERLEVRAPVVTLASRRRRMASTAVLAAAAAVVVGVGIGQVLPGGESGNDAATTSQAGGTAESQLQADSAAPSEGSGAYGGASEDSAKQNGPTDDQSLTARSVPSAGPDDELRALSSTPPLKPQVRKLRRSAPPETSAFAAGLPCTVDAANSRGQSVITYDGLPGVLVYRAPAGANQRVDIYVCGSPEPVRSVRLRTR